MSATDTVTVGDARRLLLRGAGLLDDPGRRATAATVRRSIERIGFVQVDTINVVERAHQHVLMSRFDGYRPPLLKRLLEKDRSLFEHWTHDASIIPTIWFPQWRARFERFQARWHESKWWAWKMGDDVEGVTRFVLDRVRREGPLSSRDFEKPDDPKHRSGPWWGWKPAKAGLEFLWRSGELSVTGRDGFQKVYDLTERVLVDHHHLPAPDREVLVDWACAAALDRLSVASPAELAGFWGAVSLAEARAWAKAAVDRDGARQVRVEGVDGGARPAVAVRDWRRRARRAADPPARIRPLSPFDPAFRDRKRAERLFGFEYRFEAFVPAPKRRFGYYVLPLLEGDRVVGRLDPKFHRDRGVLEIRGLWWEKGVKATAARRRALKAGLEVFADQIGAASIEHAR